jgi:hypothetical protein
VPAFGASEPVSLFHVIQTRQQTFFTGAFQQSAELTNPARTANEHLDSTGIAGQIRLVFLGKQNFPWHRTYGTREHLFPIQSVHFEVPPYSAIPLWARDSPIADN